MLGKKDSPSLNAARQGKQIKVAIIIVFISQFFNSSYKCFLVKHTSPAPAFCRSPARSKSFCIAC